MYRDEGDLELLTELAGVLDQTVTARGLSPGTYLVLRQLVADDETCTVTGLAARVGASPDEVAEMCGRLVQAGLAEARAAGMLATAEGRALAVTIQEDADSAIRDYVLQRPHTATVYGLVAAMQAGRFTLEDLIEFLTEEPGEDAPDAA